MIEKLIQPTYETLLLTFVPLIISCILGFILGTLIFITSKSGPLKKVNHVMRMCNKVSDLLVSVFRSIPYTILLIWLIPFAKLLTGSMLGAKAAIPSLVVSATPFVARMVTLAFCEVDKGVVEAALSMGANIRQIISKIYLKEAKPALISSITVTAINLVGYTTMAGAIGSGGLGFVAYNQGFLRNDPALLLVATIIIISIVLAIQSIGNYLSIKSDKRK